jgi:hypothetical protein
VAPAASASHQKPPSHATPLPKLHSDPGFLSANQLVTHTPPGRFPAPSAATDQSHHAIIRISNRVIRFRSACRGTLGPPTAAGVAGADRSACMNSY